MTLIAKRIFFNCKFVNILNGLYKSPTEYARQVHLLGNHQISMTASHLTALSKLNNSRIALPSIVYNPVRFRSKGKQSNKNNNENSDDESDDYDSSEFKEGDKSDRNLTRIKVQTLRLDTVIKAGLGISKR